jgi:hypothetical protein
MSVPCAPELQGLGPVGMDDVDLLVPGIDSGCSPRRVYLEFVETWLVRFYSSPVLEDTITGHSLSLSEHLGGVEGYPCILRTYLP